MARAMPTLASRPAIPWWVGAGILLWLLWPKKETTGTTPPSVVWADARVEPTHTVYTAAQVKNYLTAALQEGLGRAPTAQEVRTLVAQSAFETANWQKMWNNNFANITTTNKKAPYFQLHEQTVHFYKAYDTPELGARSFVQLVKGNYKDAWSKLNDPAAYAAALCKKRNADDTCASGFYEAHVSNYQAGVLSKQKLV